MLRISQLQLKRGGRQVLSGIDLDFPSQGLFGILGPNGSGKTSLFRGISGVWQPCAGSVTWHNEPILSLSPEQRSRILSVVPQTPSCPFPFRVRELVAMGRYALGAYNDGNDAVVKRCLEKTGTLSLAERHVPTLSSGERQRVYIARALAAQAPILLLDEPSSNLDIRHELEIWKLLRTLASDKHCILAAIHDLRLAEQYCDAIAVLHEGRVYSKGALAAVLDANCLHDVFGVAAVPNTTGCPSFCISDSVARSS